VVSSTDPLPRFEVLAEDVFARHNRDDRPDGQLFPSMSIGDVVMFGEVAMSVDGLGFARVDVEPGDLVVDRSWRQVIDQDRAAAPSLSRTIVSGWTQQPSATSRSTSPRPAGRTRRARPRSRPCPPGSGAR
jgi:hypothetical protein